MKPIRFTSTALFFFLLLGIAAPASAHNGNWQGNSDKQDKTEKKADKRKSQPGADKQKGKQKEEQAAEPQGRPEQRHQANEQRQNQGHQPMQAEKVQPARPLDRDQQQPNQQLHNQHRQPVQVVQQPQDDRPSGWDKGKKVGWGTGNVPPGQQTRLPQERQQQLIQQQQQRVVVYRQHLDEQQIRAQQFAAQLQQQNRLASYRYQQQYLERLRQQRLALQRAHDYNNDPYYYTAPIYRYNRGGSDYEINQYGADSLRQAVNNGYGQGYQAGQAARQDRWASRYQDIYAYQDANYGYDGYYVDQGDYNYYFREGFSRGYEDGYNSRNQYGQYSGGSYSLLGAVLSTILNFQSLR